MMIRNGMRPRRHAGPGKAAAAVVLALAAWGTAGAEARPRGLTLHRGTFPVIGGTLEVYGSNLLGDEIISGRSGYRRSTFGTMEPDPDFPDLRVPGPLDR